MYVKDPSIQPFDPESEEFYDLVEDAWYYETKGEIFLSKGADPENPEEVDDDLRRIVTALANEAIQQITTTAAEQMDGLGEGIIGPVPANEIARRIATSLNIIWFGGR